MNNQDRLYSVFQSLFKLPASELNDDASQDSIVEWDSLGMVTLVAELEREFNVAFELLEIADFKTIGIIKTILMEKGIAFD